MRGFWTILFGRRARRRWIHLILGGALAMPYVLVGSVVIGPLTGVSDVFTSLTLQLGSFAVGLPLAAVTALFPLTRPISVAAVRALCGVPADALADGPPRSRAARGRTVAWFTLHLGFGGVLSGMTLALPPFAVTLMALPCSPGYATRPSRCPKSCTTPGRWRSPLSRARRCSWRSRAAPRWPAPSWRGGLRCSSGRPRRTGSPQPSAAPPTSPYATGSRASCTTRWATP